MHEIYSINPAEKIPNLPVRNALGVQLYKKAGYNQKEIAKELSVHPSTISRELRRNRDTFRGYNPELAQIQSSKKHKEKSKRQSITKRVEKYIRIKLKEYWSPEQISGRMKLDIGESVVHETIYRYIYKNKVNGGKLYKSLRHKNTSSTSVRPSEA